MGETQSYMQEKDRFIMEIYEWKFAGQFQNDKKWMV